MTISTLSGFPYASLLSNQSSSGNSAGAATGDSKSIGSQLLAAVAQSEGANGTASDSSLQNLVSLSPAALGQANTALQTYNAKGLLQQIQSSMMLNDPLLQSDTSTSGNALGDSLLQSLASLEQTSAATANSVAPATPAPQANSASAADNAASQAAASAPAATDPNANWAKLLKQNPALASVLAESQTNQGLISLLGT